MIKFKNINGDVFLAVGSIKRKSALNGEKSLTGTLFEGDDVLNKIDKGWSLEFDNEPYVVTYFERNDNDNTVEFDAIHKFFWYMNKSVLYSSASGSHTAKWYLDQIFNGTGYTYALNFDPSAFEKENWGMKNKLSLFNDAISGMGGEFEINGTLVSIFKNIGSDLSTIVRHGFNLSDMSLENDNTDFVTYGEGFGAYADQENQTGERLHVTYTSPLAKTFGKLHAEPIDDQRYTIKDNLLQAIKDKVDGSFAISIKLSLYDLTAAGYPYKMANVGDWLLAIDENLDFKQKIRIISVDDEFATDGTRISYTVTCGDIGVVQKYQQANASLGQKVDSAYQNAQDAKESSIQAVIAANGKNTNYYVDGVENLPTTANDGDVTFVQTGDGQAMYIYTKLPDGSFKWVKRLDPDTGEQIAAGVDLAIETAQSQAATMDEIRASEAAVFQSEANAALSSTAAERAVFSSNATSMANSAAIRASSLANSAAAYGKAQAASALSSANLELVKAKQELGSEVSKAQSDIVAANNELAGKVSQTDFDTVTGDLTTKYGQVKETADAVTADVAKYKQTNDGRITANEANITANTRAIGLKVSQTDFDATTKDVNSKIASQQITVDGIKNTVTELQAKANAQGQVNQLMNTEFTPDLEGWTSDVTDISSSKPYISSVRYPYGSRSIGFNTLSAGTSTYAYLRQYILFSKSSSAKLSISWRAYGEQVANYNNMFVRFYDSSNTLVDYKSKRWATTSSRWEVQKIENITVPDTAVSVQISFETREGSLVYLLQPMVTFTDTVGDYVAGNYNNNNRVAALEINVDGLTGLVNDPSKGLSATWNLASNGQTIAVTASSAARVAQGTASAANSNASKAQTAANDAQTDATTAITKANGVQTTVTSVQGDVKDLQGQYTLTANQISQEIIDRKNGDSASETLLKNLIDQRVNDVTTGYTGAIQTMANGIYASVSMPNKLVNTEFEPDLEGWTIGNPQSGTGNPARIYTSNGYKSSNGLRINAYTDNTDDIDAYYQIQQIVKVPSNVSVASLHIMGFIYVISSNGNAYVNANVTALDSTGKNIGTIVPGAQLFDKTNTTTWQESSSKFINMSIPTGTDSLKISVYARGQTSVNISQPMLVFANAFSIYQAGSYNNMGTSTVLSLLKDNWAIGVTDNIGLITNGIIGDNKSIALISDSVVIKSPSTQITGTTWITSAMIKDGAIGNAQIGNAAISSAQIINVDVSKISGNIANFITGNINTLNSSVLYGNTGHLTTVDTGLIINNQDDHLQLSAHGQYDVPTKRAQFELLGYADNIDSNMQGSLNYYKNPHNAGTGLGIRFYGNQILAIDEAVSTGNLYLSPYASGQVQVVNRDRNGFQDIKASNFVSSSERKYKSDIKSFDEDALAIVNNTKIRQYIKNDKPEIGVIADEAPEQLLTEDGKGITMYDMIAVLYKAVQELNKKVETNNG